MNDLSRFLTPRSVAVVGASNRPLRAGNVVMKNLLHGGFNGTIMPVTPRYTSVCGVLSYKTINDLPIIPDIAVLCTHASRNISIFQQLAAKKVPNIIVLSSDMYSHDAEGKQIQAQCLEISRQAGIRVIGPNSLGIILPWISFNASFSPVAAIKGNIAFFSQSAALCTTVLDWANESNIGFSAFISLGNASDVDFSDLLDYFSTDRHTDAILLYIDSIHDARRFISAARAASRNRRILVLKAGRTEEGRKAAQQHTGGADTLDIIYDSAIQRSGMLRVQNTHELFAAVETLTHPLPLRGERLAIITNGGGPAIMAIDTLLERGGKLATLTDELTEQLNHELPASWSHANPVDLVGDAGHQRYVAALNLILDAEIADAILIMHSPSAVAESDQTARAIINALEKHPRSRQFNILTNWSGEKTARSARQLFWQAGIPTYRTPESAVIAFMHMVNYKRNQQQLMETPTTADSLPHNQIEQANQWIESHLSGEKTIQLDTHQIGGFLRYFDFHVLPTWMAQDSAEAVHIAENIGYPVTVKLRSPDIAHKSDVQGVMLNLRNRHEVSSAAQAILDRTQLSYPSAIIHGLAVQAMAKRAGGEELRIKVKHDETFGPVILLGQGGSEWQEATEAEAALPPLNMALAQSFIANALKNGKVRLQRQPDPVRLNGLAEFLVRLSQLIESCPHVHELDIHPMLINGDQFTILDADLSLKPFAGDAQNRLAIRPYPAELEEKVSLKNMQEKILIRPILPEDEPLHAAFIHQVSKEDLYKRFFTEVGEFSHETLANLTQIDYDREMAFVAVRHLEGEPEILGVSRALITPDNSNAEFAILIRSDLKGVGLGRILMEKIIGYCKAKGTRQITGITMPTNRGMLTLGQKLGFTAEVDFEEGTAEMLLKL